jgi:hypothetical protein
MSTTAPAGTAEAVGPEAAPRLSGLSRRAILGLGTLGALRPATAEAQVRQVRRNTAQVLPTAEMRLLRRITMGVTPEDIAFIYSVGYAGYLEWQLGAQAIADPGCDVRLAARTSLGLAPFTLYTMDSGVVTKELAEAAVLRAVYSNRQLLERMVEFWGDHFHTSIGTVGILKTAEDRDVIRRGALSNYFDLLTGSASSPAMLTYLNNTQSTRTAPNQNYARELMELHTLGVDGGYTQKDVEEVARCFTGWRTYGNTGDPRAGMFYYDSARHDTGSKLVLGVTIATGGGFNDGMNVLRILADHPSTATFVARKLLRWLLDPSPSTTLVADIAGEFTRTRGDVKAVVRRILSYENMLWAPPLFKRPFHLVASALRVLQANVTALDTIRSTYLSGMGHAPFAWGPPNGYPQSYEYWGGLPLPRWNLAFNLANGSVSGVSVDVQGLTAGATTAEAIVDRIDRLAFAGEMPAAQRASLAAYIGATPTLTKIKDAFGLALASPAFQWH